MVAEAGGLKVASGETEMTAPPAPTVMTLVAPVSARLSLVAEAAPSWKPRRAKDFVPPRATVALDGSATVPPVLSAKRLKPEVKVVPTLRAVMPFSPPTPTPRMPPSLTVAVPVKVLVPPRYSAPKPLTVRPEPFVTAPVKAIGFAEILLTVIVRAAAPRSNAPKVRPPLL